MSDQETKLLRRAKSGDRGAFSLLARRHIPWLVAYFRTQSLGLEAPEDLAQEALLALFQNLSRVQEKSAGPYLRGIARNLLQRAYQRRTNLREVALTEEVAAPTDPVDSKERLAHALATLPDELSVVLSAYYAQQYTYEEIARRLGLSRATVQSRLRRALALLRNRLRSDPVFSGDES